MKTSFVPVLPLLFAVPLFAQLPVERSVPGLPSSQVRAAIETHPKTRAAEAKVEAARQGAGALRVGTHEFAVSGDYGRRSIEGEGNFNEYSVTVERALRLPGKGGLDRKAGNLAIEAAELRADDTRHQLALQLNELWWDWLAAETDVRILDEAQAVLERASRGVDSQLRVQDAAMVDVDRAKAEVQANKAALDGARGRASVARNRLNAQFPDLVVPAQAPSLPEPGLPATELSRLRDAVLTCDHELPAAMVEADRLAALSARSRRDRLADPTIGARIFSERNGLERGAGLLFSIPIGGRYRSALSGQARAVAQVAAADVASIRFDVLETAATDHATALGSVQAWLASRTAAASSLQAASRLRAGYRLGHVDLADLLYAERQAKEAALAESQARIAALRAEARLQVDAHALWLDCGHEEKGAP